MAGGSAALGMGCSRLGSVLARGGPDAARDAVRTALDGGIAFFDTANIYGQGSSELILGRTLPRTGVEVCTKAGQVAPLPLWMLRAIKPAVRLMAGRGGAARERMATQRARNYPFRFDPGYLSRALGGSLRRLRRERVDMFLLHGPAPAMTALADRDWLWRWVDGELARGRIGAFGVSGTGGAEDLVWLDHPQVRAVQIPAASVVPDPGAFLRDPRAARVRVVVREVVGPGQRSPDGIKAALGAVRAAPGVDVALLGMSSPGHVREAVGLGR